MSGALPVHRLDVPDLVGLPFAIGTFDTIGPLARAEFPHRHTFYEVQYVTGGAGSQVIAGRRRVVDPPRLGVIGPGRVHWWEPAARVRGWVLLFQDDFLLGHPEEREVLRELGVGCPWLGLTPSDLPTFASLVDEMAREYAGRAPGYVSVLRSYLHVLLTRTYRRWRGVQSSAGSQLDRPLPSSRDTRSRVAWPDCPTSAEEVARRFLVVLADESTGSATVRAYAARLGVSASCLTESVKRVTGRTPGQLIREDRVLEAKRLLVDGRSTIRQVARAVGFVDPAYFSRFFRRETGLSPGDYRRRSGVKNTTIAV